jgi:hypothetical protein
MEKYGREGGCVPQRSKTEQQTSPQKPAFEAPFVGNGPINLFTIDCSIFSASFTPSFELSGCSVCSFGARSEVMSTK